MEKEIQRMQRVRTTLEEVPKRKILKKKFMALQSLKYGISARTIEDYLRTLIDAEKVIQDKKMIWRAE